MATLSNMALKYCAVAVVLLFLLGPAPGTYCAYSCSFVFAHVHHQISADSLILQPPYFVRLI
jgi:hypothetical protein